MRRVWINFLLLVAAIFCFIFLFSLGILYKFVALAFSIKEKRVEEFLADTFINLALSIDLSGNVVCKEFFDILLRKKEGFAFGLPDMTISECLGINQANKTLTFWGRILTKILDKIDPQHCFNSINAHNQKYINI